jgi:hypothetical protein
MMGGEKLQQKSRNIVLLWSTGKGLYFSNLLFLREKEAVDPGPLMAAARVEDAA